MSEFSKVQLRAMQPISLVKDVEPNFEVFDLIIQQQQLEEMEAFETINAEELANDVKQLICESDPRYRKYFNVEPQLVTKMTFDYDIYPEPIPGPSSGVQVLTCFSKSWSKDWGGEIIGYTECEPTDVVASFPGRVIIATTEAWWKVTQANVRAEEKLNYLFFTLNN